jgi:DNA-binding Lrp family transcriptional regulator
MALARALRVLPLEERPYAVIARRLGLTEDQAVKAVHEMLEKGILGDPGAALDGHRLGFHYNGMVTLAPKRMEQLDELCQWVVDNVEDATHVVKRSVTPPGAWRHLCYFMVHAVDEEIVKPVLRRLDGCPYLDDYMVIKSLEDLLPGVIR